MTVQVIMEVQECPRCKCKHEEVQFMKLACPIVENNIIKLPAYYRSLNITWTHWGICPETTEPILMFESRYFMPNPTT